jgi:sulfur carrier protein
MVAVNGAARELPEHASVAELVRLMGADPQARGVAVALEGEVVPRGQWHQTPLHEGARVEVLVAIQGG